ncbi:MAG: flagellar hook-length control protein FliK [Bacteroidetes bacterium]|nr:flagellar hook-length control protein FliK [Bacteroidota bacterium]
MHIPIVQSRGELPEDQIQLRTGDGAVNDGTINTNETAVFMIVLQQYTMQQLNQTVGGMNEHIEETIQEQLPQYPDITHECGFIPNDMACEPMELNNPFSFLQEMEQVPSDPVSVALTHRGIPKNPINVSKNIITEVMVNETPSTLQQAVKVTQEQISNYTFIGEEQTTVSTTDLPQYEVKSIGEEDNVPDDSILKHIVHSRKTQGGGERALNTGRGDQRLANPVADNATTESEKGLTTNSGSVSVVPSKSSDEGAYSTSFKTTNESLLQNSAKEQTEQQEGEQSPVTISPMDELKVQPSIEKKPQSQQYHSQQSTPFRNHVVSSGLGTMRITEVAQKDEGTRFVIEQVVQTITYTIREEISQLKVKLQPPTLGEILVKVKMERGTFQAEIDTTNPATKLLLESGLPQLREALSSRGIEMQKIDIVTSQQQGADTSERRRDLKDGKSKHTVSFRDDASEDNEGLRTLGYNTMELTL